ncbi:MAG: hypothetical protein ACT4PZ_21815 [Panacagrimonas sp.]
MRSDINTRIAACWRGAIFSLGLLAFPLAAQDSAPSPPPSAETKPEPPAKPDPKAQTFDKGFVPSEEVSPDQEVDFPADI